MVDDFQFEPLEHEYKPIFEYKSYAQLLAAIQGISGAMDMLLLQAAEILERNAFELDFVSAEEYNHDLDQEVKAGLFGSPEDKHSAPIKYFFGLLVFALPYTFPGKDQYWPDKLKNMARMMIDHGLIR
jgi:hypothetical protein